ncbi:hypothetical protein Hanom_Chr11g01034961 [Helianthus anomalus]
MKAIHVVTSVGPRLASDLNQCKPKGEGNSRRDVQRLRLWRKCFGLDRGCGLRRSVIVSCGCQDVLWLRDG